MTLATSIARAEPALTAVRKRPTPVDRLGRNLVSSLQGTNLILHGAAVASTFALVRSDMDWHVRVNTERYARVSGWGDAAYYSGYAFPIGLGPGLWAAGLAMDDDALATAGAAATQAAWMTAAMTGALKWATGRPFPNHGLHPQDPARLEHPEYAREFNFLPLDLTKGWAWPSGHTSTNFAMAAALTAALPDQLWIPFVAYPAATAIGLGMINGQHHWASDVVAGALIGQAIGWSVGRGFRDQRSGRGRASAIPMSVMPVSSTTMSGVAITGAF